MYVDTREEELLQSTSLSDCEPGSDASSGGGNGGGGGGGESLMDRNSPLLEHQPSPCAGESYTSHQNHPSVSELGVNQLDSSADVDGDCENRDACVPPVVQSESSSTLVGDSASICGGGVVMDEEGDVSMDEEGGVVVDDVGVNNLLEEAMVESMKTSNQGLFLYKTINYYSII